MKREKGIDLKALIIIVAIVIIGIFFIAKNNVGRAKPPSEYYELRLVATASEASNGTETLSIASFNTLGREVKKANELLFKNSNVNFKVPI